MRRIAHLEVPTLDRALEALALGHALDVDDLADFEDVGLDLAADSELGKLFVGNAELPEAATGIDLRLGEVSGFRLVDQSRSTHADGHLHGAVAVGIHGLDLGDPVRSRLDQGHRNGLAFRGKESAHAGLATDDAQRIFLRGHGGGLRSA